MTFVLRLAAVLLAGAASPALAVDRAAVVATYADLAGAGYADAHATARTLQAAVAALLAAPSDATLSGARDAWRAARVPYMQTEVFRFGNPIVDAWEGRVNAWPLDEGLIDYVAGGGPTDDNPHAGLNVIATPRFTLSGVAVDAAEITPALLADTLQEADAIETNVATGYHAVEFLLWGQDLNGTGPGAGARPWTDFAVGPSCTGGNCDRRGDYLRVATGLLVDDLAWMVGQWAPGGAARAAVTADPDTGLTALLTGMGSLSYGELAGERMRLGLMLNDPEEEHDCFSDTTHDSHYFDGVGIRNVFAGRYTRVDGTIVAGPSLADLLAEADPATGRALAARLDASVSALGAIRAKAEAGFAYDQMLAPGSQEGAALILAAVDALVNQTREIERAVTALRLSPVTIEGSDSLDNPPAVFQ